jgi:hypothetical protein
MSSAPDNGGPVRRQLRVDTVRRDRPQPALRHRRDRRQAPRRRPRRHAAPHRQHRARPAGPPSTQARPASAPSLAVGPRMASTLGQRHRPNPQQPEPAARPDPNPKGKAGQTSGSHAPTDPRTTSTPRSNHPTIHISGSRLSSRLYCPARTGFQTVPDQDLSRYRTPRRGFSHRIYPQRRHTPLAFSTGGEPAAPRPF